MDSHEYASKQLFKTWKKNGGSYLKLGQSVAHREHVLPDPFIKNLEPLCQENAETDFITAKKAVEKELNKKIEDVFDYFEEKPIASASIAQVHKARLKSGQYVAVKIQHPRISEYTEGDIAVGRFAARIAEYLYDVKLLWMYDELEKNMEQELSFHKEAENARKLKKLFEDDKRIVVPTVFTELSTNKLLVMSFEEGKSIIDTQYRITHGIRASEIADLLAHTFNRQIFEFGFVHSDPHQGNLFIRKEEVNGKNLTRLVLLDHGLYCNLDKDIRYGYSTLWRGIFNQNREYIEEGCKYLNITEPQKIELMVTMVTGKYYHEIMAEYKKYNTKTRLTTTKKSKLKGKNRTN